MGGEGGKWGERGTRETRGQEWIHRTGTRWRKGDKRGERGAGERERMETREGTWGSRG